MVNRNTVTNNAVVLRPLPQSRVPSLGIAVASITIIFFMLIVVPFGFQKRLFPYTSGRDKRDRSR